MNVSATMVDGWGRNSVYIGNPPKKSLKKQHDKRRGNVTSTSNPSGKKAHLDKESNSSSNNSNGDTTTDVSKKRSFSQKSSATPSSSSATSYRKNEEDNNNILSNEMNTWEVLVNQVKRKPDKGAHAHT